MSLCCFVRLGWCSGLVAGFVVAPFALMRADNIQCVQIGVDVYTNANIKNNLRFTTCQRCKSSITMERVNIVPKILADSFRNVLGLSRTNQQDFGFH